MSLVFVTDKNFPAPLAPPAEVLLAVHAVEHVLREAVYARQIRANFALHHLCYIL